MMGVFRTILIAVLAMCLSGVKAQDMHFSQYMSAPLNVNPALTGFMNGNLRVAANYRNQWFALNSFSTYAASVDANIGRSGMKYHMLGVGVSFYQDIEEKNGLSNTNVSLSTAFNIKLSNRPLQYIGVGIQPSFIRKQIDLGDAIYGTLFETGTNFDPLGFSTYNQFAFDLNFGLSYFINAGDRHMLNFGFAMSHVTQPNFGIIGQDELYRKYTGYMVTQLEANEWGTFWMMPSFFLTKQGPSVEFIPGLSTRFEFIEAINEVSLTFGAAFRMVAHTESKLKFGDLIAVAQFHIEQFAVGFSYDVTVAGAADATGRNGGPEVSVIIDLEFQSQRRKPRYFKVMKL